MGFSRWPSGKNLPTKQEIVGSIPGSGRSPGEGSSNPLQCSCLGNPMDRGAWWATVHNVKRVGHYLVTKELSKGYVISLLIILGYDVMLFHYIELICICKLWFKRKRMMLSSDEAASRAFWSKASLCPERTDLAGHHWIRNFRWPYFLLLLIN